MENRCGCCGDENEQLDECCEGNHFINEDGEILSSSVYCKKYSSINGASANVKGLKMIKKIDI